ncbi:MAG: NAD-dependent deacylase [Chloroflexi bacterium]|nr:NAD-dependent deacylase [Chloroflexota bacterium]
MGSPAEDLIKKAARDLANSHHAIALTGAGISTESGIPDFRGPSGVWTKNPEAERRAYRSYERFLEDPAGWWEERLTSPGVLGDLGSFQPNRGHYALVELEQLGALKCVITQNVDGLHEKAGTRNLLEYHGSTLKLRCTSCGSRFRREEFDLDRLMRDKQLPPHCGRCGGIVKTDGVAFGEPIPSDVARRSLEEARKCDVMLICGTSAVVYPFANLPRTAKQRGAAAVAATIIEVNAEPTPLTQEGISDYLIQGKTGQILPRMVEEVKGLRAKS